MLPLLIYSLGLLFFGFLTIYFSRQRDTLKKELAQKENLHKQRLYEVLILREIQDRIGYSLDIERVIETLTGSLKNLFSYSTASSIVLKDDRLILTTSIEEKVSSAFLQEVKRSMLSSLATLTNKPLPHHMEEQRTGFIPDETSQKSLASFFHVPLVVNGEIVGLINVSSTKAGLYQEADMTVLYKMTSQASNALSRLREVINTENGKLSTMIGSLSDGIVMLDEKQQIALMNTAAKDLFGIHKEKPSILDIVSALPKTCDFSEKLQEAVITGKTIEEKELAIGRNIVQLFITPVFGLTTPTQFDMDAPKKIIGFVLLIHDITLEKSLAEMKETFTQSVIHELRSPLTAIKAASEILETDLQMNASQKKLYDIIIHQSQRMLSDINTLLDAAKMQAGHFTIEKKPYAIENIIDESILIFTGQAEKKGIHVLSYIDEHLPNVAIDPLRIQQVFNNLLSNSLKFTEANGTISLRASLRWDHTLPKSTINPGIIVSISDTGSGIPLDKQQLLFSKYFQVNNTFVPGQQGTGLGLYITKGIIQAHGGTISLRSIPNQGTTISFILPIATKDDVKTSKTQSTLASSLAN